MEKHPLIRANLSSSVKQYLYKYIRSADLNGNRKLPPENVISENLGVSRVTVRRALDELEKEGMVLRMHGRGTFINPEAASIQVNLMPGEEFSSLIRKCGYTPSVEVQAVRKSAPDKTTAEILQLEQGEEIYTVEKLFFADGHPAIVSVDRFPASLAGDSLTEEEIKTRSTFDILKERAGCVVVRDKIRIETMEKKEAAEQIRSGARMECGSILVFRGINYSQDNEPVIYDTEYYDTRYVPFNLMRLKDVYD